MTRRTVLLQAALVAAVLVVACAAALVMVSQKAEATFPGQNGKIAYSSPQSYVSGASDREIYTINPDGGGKFQVTHKTVGRSTHPTTHPTAKGSPMRGQTEH
jgi:hypothetical protein